MARLGADQLAELTLLRQFPTLDKPSPRELRTLFRRLGPVQSQVPRAPFLAAASRLPGIDYHTVCAELEAYRLVKTTSLRGTVHTSLAEDHPALDAVARTSLQPLLRRTLGLDEAAVTELITEIETFCTPRWRTRDELCDHVDRWLSDRGSSPGLTDSHRRGLIWGYSGLLRRPKDAAWEKRTDTFHRTAVAVREGGGPPDPESALTELIIRHCAAHGPVHRTDLAVFFAAGLTRVDEAVGRAGGRLVRHTGPDGEPLIDVAHPPRTGLADPGCRLLGEFDALLLGFHGHRRTRFCTERELAAIWRKANGLFAPVVLHDQRLVATWRSVPRGRRTDLEITMLPGRRPLPEDTFAAAAGDVARALDYQLGDLRVLSRDVER